MDWNTAPGKSKVLLPPRGHQNSTFFLSGEPLRNVESSVYLGVSLTTSGITEEKHVMRVKAAQRRLMQLSPMGIHIRSFNTNCGIINDAMHIASYYLTWCATHQVCIGVYPTRVLPLWCT